MVQWDVIVLGLGGVGSAAVRHLASRGCRVLGLDQYAAGHAYGSSHGQTRIIRQAYFEAPDYVPLLQRAYELWEALEHDTAQELFVRCGLVELGPPHGVVIPGVIRSAEEHGLPIERLAPDGIRQRWPGIEGDADWQAVIESNAGFLRVESCVLAHLQMAQHEGADCRFDITSLRWQADGSGVRVVTSEGTHQASHLIVAGGPWSGQLLGNLGLPLQVLRKHLYWFEVDSPGFSVDEGFPCFFHETDAGLFYGFPAIDSSGVKVARHSGGEKIAGPDPVPMPVGLDAEDFQLVEEYVRRYLPGVSLRLSKRAGCYYTVTPDEHFVVDRHPEFPQVTLVTGLSGHGFKFASVLGELAAKLAVGESPGVDLTLFRADRFLH